MLHPSLDLMFVVLKSFSGYATNVARILEKIVILLPLELLSYSIPVFHEMYIYSQVMYPGNCFFPGRGWEKFHTPRNICLALSGEAGELCELFQFKDEEACCTGLPGWTRDDRDKLSQVKKFRICVGTRSWCHCLVSPTILIWSRRRVHDVSPLFRFIPIDSHVIHIHFVVLAIGGGKTISWIPLLFAYPPPRRHFNALPFAYT